MDNKERKALRAKEKKDREDRWVELVKKKQKTPSRLRTGRDIPYSKKFSEVTITSPDGTVEVVPAKKRAK